MDDPILSDALDTCAGIEELCEQLAGAFEEIGGLGRAGRDAEADVALAEASESMLLLVQACEGVAHAMGPAGEALKGVSGRLQPWLAELVTARERGDWVHLCDVLAYEVAPRVGEVGPSARRVLDQAAAAT